ncbi:MAG: LytTR family DNA-binding domain-containing protein [Brachymonas sp.]|nr:LytTR family DNA-binding domain-containing protein [Brachymonas sp.]
MSTDELLRVLLVDDEPLARSRLRTVLQDIKQPPTEVCGEAETAAQAMGLIASARPEVLLLDIHMPGMDGMQLAQRLRQSAPLCQIIFVTASNEHALQAFDVAAADYLTKPVRAERLQQALLKAMAQVVLQRAVASASPPAAMQPAEGEVLLIQERGQSMRLPLAEILYARAESKYVVLYLRSSRELLWDGSLNQLEEQYPAHFVRVHRNALAQRQALRQIKRCVQADGSEGWLLQLEGSNQSLQVSRRQLPVVRQAMQSG